MKKLYSIFLAFGLLATTASLSAGGKKGTDTADKRKADYVYMEALRQEAFGNRDAYYTLMRRAEDLDPDETVTGNNVGFYDVIMFSSSDSVMLNEGVAKMKRHFDVHPEDYYASLNYGSVMAKLGVNSEAVRVWTVLDSIFPDKPDVALNLGEVLAQSGDSANVVQALEIFNRLEKTMGRSLLLTGNKVRIHLAVNDTTGAMSEVGELIKAHPGDISALLMAGDLNMALQRPDSALVYYDLACETDSTSGPAFYKRASYYQAVGDTARYDQEILTSLNKSNLDLDVKMELLRIYLSDSYADSLKQPAIEQLFSTMIDRHPHEVDLHKLYASYLVARNDFARAAEQQSYALDIDPSDENAWRGLISLYISAGNVGKQIETGRNALRYFPESPELHWFTSMSLLQDKQNGEALQMVNKALALARSATPRDEKLLSQIECSAGDIYYQDNQTDSAFVHYEASLQHDPDNMLALNNCAYYLACQDRDLDRAEEMSSRTIASDPDNATALDTYAWILFKKRDYKTAKEFIDKTLELESEPSVDLYHHAGDIYFMSGDPVKALEFWKKALELEPDNELLKRKVKHRTYFYE